MQKRKPVLATNENQTVSLKQDIELQGSQLTINLKNQKHYDSSNLKNIISNLKNQFESVTIINNNNYKNFNKVINLNLLETVKECDINSIAYHFQEALPFNIILKRIIVDLSNIQQTLKSILIQFPLIDNPVKGKNLRGLPNRKLTFNQLQRFRLKMNKYTLEQQDEQLLITLLTHLKESKELQYLELDLSGCVFPDFQNILCILNQLLGKFKQLNGLTINLSCVLLVEIFDIQSDFVQLKHLDLNFNCIGLKNKQFQDLVKLIKQQKELETLNLNLSSNQIYQATLEQLLFVIQQLDCLNNVNIQLNSVIINQLNNQDPRLIICTYKLDLQDSILYTNDWINLLNFRTINNLTLNISNIQLKLDTLQELGQKLSQINPIILVLNLSNCRINDSGLLLFGKQLSKCHRLVKIDLDLIYNNLTQSGEQLFLSQMIQNNLVHLRVLYNFKMDSVLLEHFALNSYQLLSCNLIRNRKIRQYLTFKQRLVHLFNKLKQLNILVGDILEYL